MLTALSWQFQRVIPQNQAELHGSIRTTTVLSRTTPLSQESNTVGGYCIHCFGCRLNRQSNVGMPRALYRRSKSGVRNEAIPVLVTLHWR